jgi:hypothetical protein
VTTEKSSPAGEPDLSGLGPEELDFIFALDTSVLVALVHARIQIQQMAEQELLRRGFNRNGQWIGFDEGDLF